MDMNNAANITVRKLLPVAIDYRNSNYVYGDVGKSIFDLKTRKITIIH